MKRYVKIMGTGSYLPGQPVPFKKMNDYLGPITKAKPMVQKWVKNMEQVMGEMLDIESFHYAIDPKTGKMTEDNISMSVKAAEKALRNAKLEANAIDLLIFAGPQVDQMPTVSPRIQEALGIKFCSEMTIHSNCTSPYKAMLVAHDMIKAGRHETIMIVSSNISSSGQKADYYNQEMASREDLLLRWFLCDGAGAIILGASKDKKSGVYLKDAYSESAGFGRKPVMYDKKPAYKLSPKIMYEKGLHHISQDYKEIIMGTDEKDNLGKTFVEGVERMVSRGNIDLSKVKYFQINLPAKHVFDLVKEQCDALGIPGDSYYTKLNKMGYCGPPMMLICLDKILQEEKVEPGDYILSFVTEVSKILQAGYLMEAV